jgi:hypothetical protein
MPFTWDRIVVSMMSISTPRVSTKRHVWPLWVGQQTENAPSLRPIIISVNLQALKLRKGRLVDTTTHLLVHGTAQAASVRHLYSLQRDGKGEETTNGRKRLNSERPRI